MRVGQTGTNSVQSGDTAPTGKTNRTGKSEAAQKSGDGKAVEGGTRAEISAKAHELAKAKAAASDTPDVREEKIAELKSRIAAGKYHVDPEAVADRMVDEHMQMG